MHRRGVEIFSTGGTAAFLRKRGVPVKDVSRLTRFPEILGGRVKTLHPRLHAALLAVRDDPEHVKTLAACGIRPIELVVVNLYPFGDAARSAIAERKTLEMIDIGGPSMLRSAAKNFNFVAAVCDPRDYGAVRRELAGGGLALSQATRRRLAAKVFRLTSRYDGLIREYLEGRGRSLAAFPAELSLRFEKIQELRYGENPHQRAAVYRERNGRRRGVVDAKKLHGKELSFNNLLDLDAALEAVEAFREPACAIIKHTSPCGFAVGPDARTAFKNAYLGDPLSAFGSVVGFNTALDEGTAGQILKSGFIECVIAKAFTKRALALLKTRKNLRLLAVKGGGVRARHQSFGGQDFKKVSGGLLLQDRDTKDPAPGDLRCVTKTPPKPSQVADLLFAFRLCRYVKSNAIVVAKRGAAVGMGMGQPSRVDSCLAALEKAGRRARGAVLASDGFFPKPDSIALARRFGIRAIIQPGGSIQDDAVIKACNRAGISMVFTRIRHFKH